jgi:hypothetical protein
MRRVFIEKAGAQRNASTSSAQQSTARKPLLLPVQITISPESRFPHFSWRHLVSNHEKKERPRQPQLCARVVYCTNANQVRFDPEA